jgi:hypothetical protein
MQQRQRQRVQLPRGLDFVARCEQRNDPDRRRTSRRRKARACRCQCSHRLRAPSRPDVTSFCRASSTYQVLSV